MKSNHLIAGMAACFIAAGCFAGVVSAADVTEQDCIHGGGYVTEKCEARFCVGGKYDLSEVRGPVKNANCPDSASKQSEKQSMKVDYSKSSGSN